MVDKDDKTSNENETDRSTDAAAPRRRSRLFGSRRAKKEAPERTSPAAEAVNGDAPEASGETVRPRAEKASVEKTPATPPAPPVEKDRGGRPESAVPKRAEERPSAAAPAVEGTVPESAEEPEPPALPSTAILFQAPPVLEPLPARDEDRDDESRGGRRRSRRRGRGGSSGDGGERREPELITEPQKVKGSTRLEAKKQRRRDGRDAGRRRSVITEAEFLARRESVERSMVVRAKPGRIQIGVLEDGVLVEHYVAKSQESSLIGNVYLGKVQNVLPSMEAAFVDIGRGRNAVLYSGEVDWDSVDTGKQGRRIEAALKPGDKVLVQVTKDPVGHKGARLTSQVSLPGRFLVYVPGGSMNGISRKLPDTERARLKKILKEVLPESAGVIVRTAAEGATEEQLTLDVNRLTTQWEEISAQVEKAHAPAMLHSEPDLLIKIVRDVFNEDFQKLIVSGDDARATIEKYLGQVAPDLLDRVVRHEGERDAFDEYRITEQIEKALDRKVWLPSGGSLIIDRTEAMTVIDVNTGKFVGSGGNLEETVTKNNLEAAEEIVRQLRLRDVGGIIVVDFIDMVLENNRDLVLRRLVECLSRDRTKHQVAEVTSLGLVQMTRKKLGLGLLETFSEACEACAGRGVIVHHDPVVKHKGQQGGDRRRGKGGKGGGSGNGNNGSSGSGNGNNGNGNGGAHAITDDAKKGLAQIAASTIAPSGEESAQNPAAASEPEQEAERASRARRGRGSRRAQDPGGRAEAPVEKPEGKPAAGAGTATLDALNIPLPEASTRREKPEDTEQLLDSVLDSLPAPKKPGAGRGRSRRVTTPALSGTAVAPSEDTEGEKPADGENPAS